MIFFKNARVLTPLSAVDGIVAVRGGCIQGVHARLDIPAGASVIDARGLYLAPGFIDMHVHGGGGYGVMGAAPEDVVKMCRAHALFGTTSMVPTTLAAPISEVKKAIDAVRGAKGICKDCNILGIHLEGPFLSQGQRGAQSEDSILVASQHNYIELLNYWDGIKIMGAAPEADGCLQLGRELRSRNILASIAHSDASYDQVTEAILCGYSDVTHIYSGCSSIVRVNGYRVPGVVEAGLLRDELSVQVIADLKHLPPALLMLIYKCKGAGGISLITDGLEFSASELREGTVYTQKNGVETVYEDGVMKLMDRQAFAGSVATANRLVRNMVQHAGVPLLDAVKMATTTPAKRLNIAHVKGMVAKGYDADLVLFDENIEVQCCMVAGTVLFNKIRG